MIKYSQIVRNRGNYIKYLDKRKYQVTHDFRYWIDYEHKNEYVYIEKAYIFDFNSSPCFANCIVDRDEFVIAVVHDKLYSRGGTVCVIDPNNLSEKFKNLQKHGYGFGYKAKRLDGKNTTSFLYNRRFADMIWLSGAIEEAREIEHKDKRFKARIGYLGLRLGGWRNFKN